MEHDEQNSASSGPQIGRRKAVAIAAGLVGLVVLAAVLASGKAGLPHRTQTKASVSGTRPSPSPVEVPRLDTSGALIEAKGIGIEETGKFTVEQKWDVAWAYDCSNIRTKGRFGFGVGDSATRRGYTDTPGVKVFGDKGSGVQHYQRSGTFFLVVDSHCLWHVVVKQ